jgi:hypothetical protein
VFLESTDRTVLQNSGLAIVALAKGNHARSGEALLHLKKIASSLRDRLLELFEQQAKLALGSDQSIRDDDAADDDSISRTDNFHAINMCLRRLTILSKRWYIPDLLMDGTNEDNSDHALDRLCTGISVVVTKNLEARKVVVDESSGDGEDSSEVEIPKIWTTGDQRIHDLVAETVTEALAFILSNAAWRLSQEIRLIDEGVAFSEASNTEHVIVRLRESLAKLISLCFEQYIEVKEGDDKFSPEHIRFSVAIQEQAGAASGDLRSLFPKQWAQSSSSLLRSFSFTKDGHLIGGFVRFLRSQEFTVRGRDR